MLSDYLHYETITMNTVTRELPSRQSVCLMQSSSLNAGNCSKSWKALEILCSHSG
jgi:hypothetical protein